MPMHCSANAAPTARRPVFFGLSGTGKTTLSADPYAHALGDDEHGWSDDGIFNFEGGCYAKTIRLSREAEPEIYATTERFGTVMENVVIDPVTRRARLRRRLATENTRCAYPLDFISNASTDRPAGAPQEHRHADLRCLWGDAADRQAHPGARRCTTSCRATRPRWPAPSSGVTEPEATFSTCFGAPFMPRHPSAYGNLLRELIAKHSVDCWLVNTGWTGGARRRPAHADPRDARLLTRR